MFECLLLLLPAVPVDASQLLYNSKGQTTEMTASLCNFQKKPVNLCSTMLKVCDQLLTQRLLHIRHQLW